MTPPVEKPTIPVVRSSRLGPMNTNEAFIVVAVEDPLIHPEALHAAAATTRPVVDLISLCDGQPTPAQLRRYAQRAAAVLIDDTFAGQLGGHRISEHILFVAADERGIDYEKALACHAAEAFLLPAQTAALLSRLGKATPDRRLSSSKALTIAVTASAGGVGTSTFSAFLASSLAGPVTLIDAKSHSGGIDLLLGIEDIPGLRWPDISASSTEGTIDAQEFRCALPSTSGDVAVLSAARAVGIPGGTVSKERLDHVIDILRPGGGTIVVDTPALTEPPNVDLVVVIVPAEIRPVAAAAQFLKQLEPLAMNACVLLRHRGWSGLGVDEVERILGASVVAELPTVRTLPKAGETMGIQGRIPRAFRQAIEKVQAA